MGWGNVALCLSDLVFRSPKPRAYKSLLDDERGVEFSGFEITDDPNDEWEDRWYDLRPLRTEGQVEEYASLIAAIPLGIGFEFGLGQGWILGIEGSWRATFTDYLDDLSGMYANPDYLSPVAEAIASQSGAVGVSKQLYTLFFKDLDESDLPVAEAFATMSRTLSTRRNG